MKTFFPIAALAFVIILVVINIRKFKNASKESSDVLPTTDENDSQHKTSDLTGKEENRNKDVIESSITLKHENSYLSKLRENEKLRKQLEAYERYVDLIETSKSNLTAIPYMAAIMADYETFELEVIARDLDWGHSAQRLKKVKSIREIRKDAQNMVEKNKEAQYQLSYLLKLYPVLEDVIETDYKDLPSVPLEYLPDRDPARDYLSKEEYAALSETERNQLALDRYVASHQKSKWQIGRDYELYVGYIYQKSGYDVEYFGSYMKMDDLGRDLIATKDDMTLIVQCKYWSSKKEIHENHVNQLYGTTVCYCLEHDINPSKVRPILITNIKLTPMAKKMAEYLHVSYKENYELKDYPRIKCNIGHDEFGQTKIYHLPFDQQYDNVKLNKPGEFFAMTVAEAEAKGFRRAYKWFG